jgi:NAD(P)H-hydrate epimerase
LKFALKRKKDSRKWDNGAVLIIAGSHNYPGAAILCTSAAEAALRAGIDLVFVAAPEMVSCAINNFLPDIITIKLKGNEISKKEIRKIPKNALKCSVIVCGPGIGLSSNTKNAVAEIIALANRLKKPLVLDADAIKACAGKKFNGNVLLTPHEREFEIFSGKKIHGLDLNHKIALVKEIAKKHNCTILLKGPIDIISDGKTAILNKTGNPGMTKGGTGDILTGLCGAFIALGADLPNAAACAAYVNGAIGDILLKEKGYGFIASDFVEKIPQIVFK